MLDFYGEINKEAERLESKEAILGKGLMQPFASTNSGSRKIMFGVQLEHALSLVNAEPPIIQNGYEIRFGDRSSSIIKAESDYKVIAKISKFSEAPNHHYYLIIYNKEKRLYDVIERISYNHTTETYGYLYNNSILDSLDVGYEVPKYEILRKSGAFDQFMNRCDGVNLLTGYINKNKTTEDEIIISRSAAEKLKAPLIKKVQIPINENDILLNLFGDNNYYKSFPDINETIPENIVCAVRRENVEECFFAQSVDRLQELLMSDEKYTINGKVIDINVYCNSPAVLTERYSNSQLLKYYNDSIRFNDEFVNTINMLRDRDGNIKMSYQLSKIYNRCRQVLAGDEFVKDKPKPFKGTILEMIVLELNTPTKGDKITNRYGGKGVISEIIDDDLMPLLDNGKRMEVCFNGSTCVNRLNPGQLMEMSLTFISSRILEYINSHSMPTELAIEMIYRFMKHVSPKEAEDFMGMMYGADVTDIDRTWYIDQCIEDGYIYLSNKPITESMSLDKLNEIYKEFPFIKQYDIHTLIKDSNGNNRYIKGRRPLVCGKMYIYRLKQYAEEKFSVTSLSATNIRNENTRSKANKNYRIPHANTPIQFGDMEITHMNHMGPEAVIEALMIHSVSPQGRRLYEKALTGDPYNVNIVLDGESKNRKAEILNAYLKTMGLKLVFRKVPKVKGRAFTTKAFTSIPKPKKAFFHISDEEMKTLNLDYLAKLYEENIELANKRAFITKAFSDIDEEK